MSDDTSIARIASKRASAARSGRAMNELRMIDGEAFTVGHILDRSGLTLKQFGNRYRAGLRTWDLLKART